MGCRNPGFLIVFIRFALLCKLSNVNITSLWGGKETNQRKTIVLQLLYPKCLHPVAFSCLSRSTVYYTTKITSFCIFRLRFLVLVKKKAEV